jgi:hypothetical protein
MPIDRSTHNDGGGPANESGRILMIRPPDMLSFVSRLL